MWFYSNPSVFKFQCFTKFDICDHESGKGGVCYAFCVEGIVPSEWKYCRFMKTNSHIGHDFMMTWRLVLPRVGALDIPLLPLADVKSHANDHKK